MTSRSREPAHWLSNQPSLIGPRNTTCQSTQARFLENLAGGLRADTPSDLASCATACRFRLSMLESVASRTPGSASKAVTARGIPPEGPGRCAHSDRVPFARPAGRHHGRRRAVACDGGNEHRAHLSGAGVRLSSGARGRTPRVSPGLTTNGEVRIRQTSGSSRSHELNGRRPDRNLAPKSSLTPVVAVGA